MFASLAGLPVSEYIRRRRLTAATAEILAGDTVIDVAVRYGYGSAEAFTRAFKAFHGLTPSEARRPGALLRSQPKLRFHLRVEGSTDMQHRIVDKPAFRLVGMRTRVPVVFEGPNDAIEQFERSLDRAAVARWNDLSDAEPQGSLAVTVQIDESRTEGSSVEYWRAVATSQPAPEGVDSVDVPAGQWVVFDTEGPFPQALQHLWADAATEWFPANPYLWAPGPQLLSVQPSADGTHGRGQLWLPIEPA
jgi:AraC family transcriptional regulator